MTISENPFYLMPPLIASAISLGLIFLVLRHNFRNFTHRLFALMLTAAFFWGLSIFMLRSSPDPEIALVWSKLVNIFIPTVVVLLYHFTFIYTGLKPRKWVIPLLYSYLLLNCILVPFGLVVTDIQIKPYGYAPVAGPAFFPVAIIDYVLTVLGLYNLVKAHRSAITYETRNRYLYVTIGLGIALVGGFGDVLPLLGIHLYPGAIFGHIIFYIMTAVAMIKYHLLDISIAIRRSIAYVLMSTLIAVPYVLILLLLAHFFGETRWQLWSYTILLIVLAIAMQPFWNRVQSWANRWFYGSRYRNIQELILFSQQHFSVRSMDEVYDRYIEITRRAMGARDVYLLLPDSDDNYLIADSSAERENGPHIIFSASSPVITWFKTNSQPVSIEELHSIPQVQALTVSEYKIMSEIGTNLLIPLKTASDELGGILVLTEKQSQRPYSGEERSVLVMIAGQISVTLDNIRLYRIEREMRQEVQRQNEQKTEFLHTVAHEMKTPLTSLLSSSELLEDRIKEDDSIGTRLVDNIRRSARSMDRRVTELVDSASMQNGKIQISVEPISIGKAAADIASDMEYLFTSRQQELVLQIADDLPQVYADMGRLEQIISNLLSNASKYSPAHTGISINIREEGNSIIVKVYDEAPALSESDRTKIFDPYYRGEETIAQKEVPGLGMGLYITRKLVEAHNGRIWIERNGTKGNMFIFSIPIADLDQTTQIPEYPED